MTRILLIYTGGTIGMIEDPYTGTLTPFNFDQLLEQVPELNQIECEIETFSFENPIDSSDMQPKSWVEIGKVVHDNYDNYDGFVLLHGTDTMAYTASILSFMFNGLTKPIILTGSQLPIGMIRTDGKENLITAIEIAADQINGEPKVQEVAVYFEYHLYRGNRVSKVSANHFDAFASPNFPSIAEAGVDISYRDSLLWKDFNDYAFNDKMESNIGILKIHPGINEKFLYSFFKDYGFRGVVIETYGAGNVPHTKAWKDLIAYAEQEKISVVNVTQCYMGSVSIGKYETSSVFSNTHVISGQDMTTEAAFTKLTHVLENYEWDEVNLRMIQNLKGELTES